MEKISNNEKNIKKAYVDDFDIIQTKIDEGDIEYKYDKKPEIEEDLENSINTILLWKINRSINYKSEKEKLKKELEALRKKRVCLKNGIDKNVKEILKDLLDCEGISLPVASTIINIYSEEKYPIYDQRAHRALNALQNNTYKKIKKLNGKKPENVIKTYDEYVKDLYKYYDNNIKKDKRKFKVRDTKTTVNMKNIDQYLYQIDVETNVKIDY